MRVIGMGAALLAVRAQQTMLFGVEPLDVVRFAAVGLVVLVIAELASYLPAVRASRASALTALRGRGGGAAA